MQLRQLRHFLAAIDHGSITQAAAHQNVTQPTLSRSIRMLELSLKVDLLDRGRAGVTPTRYGEAFADHARGIVTGARHARDDVGAMREGRLGHVRLGLGASALQPVVAGALARLTLEREDLTISIDYDVVETLLGKLRRGELDAVLDMRRHDIDDAGLSFRPIMRIAMIVVARPHHPLAGRVSVSRAELAAMPWAILDQPGAENYYRQLLGASGAHNNRRIRCTAPTMLHMLAREGDFLIMTARSEISADLRSGTLVEIDSDLGPADHDLCIITRSRAYMTGALRFTLDRIASHMAGDVG